MFFRLNARQKQPLVNFRDRAMLENVADALPEYRHPSLETQLRLLDCTIESAFSYPEDRALARLADVQGLGGSPPPRDNGS
jgi:hypothetical protein